MQIIPLSAEEERATGFNKKFVITHADLTEATANTAQTIEMTTLQVGEFVKAAGYKLETPFQDASDTDLNNTTISVGDGASDTRFITATQINENGTEVDYLRTAPTYTYADATDTVDAKFGSMSGKSLSNIDTGEVHVYLGIGSFEAV